MVRAMAPGILNEVMKTLIVSANPFLKVMFMNPHLFHALVNEKE